MMRNKDMKPQTKLNRLRAKAREILDEYGNKIIFDDEDIENLSAQGTLITNVILNSKTNEIMYFAGDMFEDKYAEEVYPDMEEETRILGWLIENF